MLSVCPSVPCCPSSLLSTLPAPAARVPRHAGGRRRCRQASARLPRRAAVTPRCWAGRADVRAACGPDPRAAIRGRWTSAAARVVATMTPCFSSDPPLSGSCQCRHAASLYLYPQHHLIHIAKHIAAWRQRNLCYHVTSLLRVVCSCEARIRRVVYSGRKRLRRSPARDPAA